MHNVFFLFFRPRTIPYWLCSKLQNKSNTFLKNRVKLNNLYANLIFMQNSRMKLFSIPCKAMNLKIASLNVRGIGNHTKRREVFNWLRSKNFSIYMLQEAYCTENTTDIWTSEWGYKTLFSCCSNNKAGVGILFNNNFSFCGSEWPFRNM